MPCHGHSPMPSLPTLPTSARSSDVTAESAPAAEDVGGTDPTACGATAEADAVGTKQSTAWVLRTLTATSVTRPVRNSSCFDTAWMSNVQLPLQLACKTGRAPPVFPEEQWDQGGEHRFSQQDGIMKVI